jgi:hypothetical protein
MTSSVKPSESINKRMAPSIFKDKLSSQKKILQIQAKNLITLLCILKHTHTQYLKISTDTKQDTSTTAIMTDKNTSTLQSYVDSAVGTGQSVLGSVMGSSADQVCAPTLSLPVPLQLICITSHSIPLHSSTTTLTTPPQNAGEAKKDKAAFEHDASHAAAKAGPFSASSSGAVTKDDPNRQKGAWNQTVGSAKETVGGLVGSEVCFPLSPL